MSSIRVIVYNTPQANVVAVKTLYYQQPGRTESSSAVATNQHFVGRFHAVQHNLLPSVRQQQDVSSGAIFQALEIPTDFIGKFTAPQHKVLPALRQNEPQDTSSSAVETNQHFVPRFTAPQHKVLTDLRQQLDHSHSTNFVLEGPTHFIAKFTAPTFSRFRHNTAASDTSSSAVETNTHFIAKFKQPTFARFAYNQQDHDTLGETNPHFIGKFNPVQFQVKAPFYNTSSVEISGVPNPPILTVEHDIQVIPFRPMRVNPRTISALYYWRDASDVTPPPPAQAETNVSFIASFTPAVHTIIPPWFTAQDLSSSAVETNTHTIGRFTAPQHAVLRSLREQPDQSASTFVPIQPDANVHFVPRYTPVRHTVLPLLRSNIAVDVSSSAMETNTHFMGRFTQPTFVVLPMLRQRTADDFSSSPPVTSQPRIHPFFATMGQMMGY